MSDIEIEIDGTKLLAKPNSMVIQVADAAGIYIPRFCYHKHLSIAANCRMCLVEVEKAPKPMPACATPVMPGMKIFTKSAKALAAQKAVMEFLLINHPLDCPICDQGGECELQDLSLGFGAADSNYDEKKRVVLDKDIGPLVATDMTRCIQCTRCVRFGDEIAGLRELGATGRGEHMEIGTYVEHAMRSEVAGNIIDICPVGALTSKPFRFKARAWELNQFPSVSPHDCLGSNLFVHTRYGKVMRVVPRENNQINETWIADRDRFSYEGLYHADRLSKPMIRVQDRWQETDWPMALEVTMEGLQKVLNKQGGDGLAGLASPNATLEEFYLLQKLLRGVGSPHLDHRLREVDFADQETYPLFPGLGMSIHELEECDTIILVGSNIQKEQPSAALRIRKAALKGAQIFSLNMLDFAFHFKLAGKEIVTPSELLQSLVNLAKALEADEQKNTMAQRLKQSKKACILLGNFAHQHPQSASIRHWAQHIAKLTGAQLGLLTEGANAAGAWLAGVIPHRGPAGAAVQAGKHIEQLWREARQSYMLLHLEPDLDCANPVASMQALQQAEFVVALSCFKSPSLEQVAHVILPIAPFTETAGTFVNTTGEFQEFNGVATPFGESRPAWKVLRVLGNLLQVPGFDYISAEEVREEIKGLMENAPKNKGDLTVKNPVFNLETAQVTRIAEIPIYSGDSLVRRSKPLEKAQENVEGKMAAVRMHPQLAKRLVLEEGMRVIVRQKAGQAELPVRLDTRVPESCVLIASGIKETTGLPELFGAVEIEKNNIPPL